MTVDETQGGSTAGEEPAASHGQGGAQQQSEEELREQLEEEIRKVRVEDVILQSVVSILNLAARRIAKDDERDLAQGKLGIDAASAMIEMVPGDAQDQLREAVSELQLLYAKHAGEEGGAENTEAPSGDGEDENPPPAGGDSPLWTPGS
jgi:hypothetical protein